MTGVQTCALPIYNTIDTKGIDGGLASLNGGGKIGLPDVAAGYEPEREDKGGSLDSRDGGLKLGWSTIEVDVETSNGKFSNKVEVGVEPTEVGSQEDLGGDRGKFSIGCIELVLELETSIENEDGLVDLNPLCTSSLELSQKLLVQGEDLGEERDRRKVGGGILSSLAQPQVGDGTQDDRAGCDTESLCLFELFNGLVEVELEVGGLGELGYNEMVVRIEPVRKRESGTVGEVQRREKGTPFFHLTSGNINIPSLTATTHGKVDIEGGEVVSQITFWDDIEGSRVIQDMVIQGEFATTEMKRSTVVIGSDDGE